MVATASATAAGAASADPATPAGLPAGGGQTVVTTTAPAQETRPFSITPSIGIEELYTDNVLLSATDRRADEVTEALAGLNVNVNDGPVVASLTSQASYDAYGRNSRLNGWSAEAYGTGSWALVKNLLSIDVAASTTDGYTAELGTPVIDRSGLANRVQLSTYDAGPHLTTTIGDLADLDAVARFAQVYYSAAAGSTVAALPTSSSLVQVAGQADTGTRVAKLESVASAEYESDDHGFDTANGVESLFLTVLPDVRLIARGGFETVYVPKVADINAPVLSAGFQWSPNAQSRISVEGGERYNRGAWAANAYIQVANNLYFIADYDEVLEPDQVYVINSFLDFVQLSQILPSPISQQNFAINGNLYNLPSLNSDADARLVYQRQGQTFGLSLSWIDRDFLKALVHDRTLVASVDYSRQLRPDLSATVTASYTRTYSSPTFGASVIYDVLVKLTYNVNSTVDLNAGYGLDHQQELTAPNQVIYENVLFASLMKRF